MSGGVKAGGGERDLRLDFFRGLALICIFIDHVPGVWLAPFTIQFGGLFDAAEVFILISGYTAGLVYGRVLEDQGAMVASLRIYHRVWQLYVAHVFLFMMFVALVGNMADAFTNPLYVEEFRAADFLKEPGHSVIMALTLRFQPAFMDILPLYIVLLSALPLFMVGVRRLAWPVLALSFALWLAVQFDRNVSLTTYPGPGPWFFNPFAWQFLFLSAAWLGWSKAKGGAGWLSYRPLLMVACAVAAVGFLLRFDWTLHYFHDPIPAWFGRTLWPLLGKSDLSPLRLINVAAVALVVARLVPRQAKFLHGRAAWPLLACGRHSLHIFCLGILLSVTGHYVLTELYGGAVLQTVVVAAGVTIMVGVAAFMDWYQAASVARWRKSSQKPATGGGTSS